MERTRRRRFLFDEHATGLSAQISSPRHDQLPVQGAASLPVGGGVSSARLEDVRFGEFASADEIEVFSEGVIETSTWQSPDERKRTAFSSSTSSVRGLNLLQTVRADRIVARVANEYPLDAAQPSISLFGSTFEGLVIGGRRVEIEYNECLFEALNYVDLDNAYKDARQTIRPEDFSEEPSLNLREYLSWARSVQDGLSYDEDDYSHGSGTADGKPIVYRRHSHDEIFRGPLLTSIVKSVDKLPKGVVCNPSRPNEIYIPGFGKIFLGELLITPRSRRLTMLRFELGCPCDGCGSSCDSGTGGSWHP